MSFEGRYFPRKRGHSPLNSALNVINGSIVFADDGIEQWLVGRDPSAAARAVPVVNCLLQVRPSREFVTRLQIVCPQLRGVLFVSEESPTELPDLPCQYAFLAKPLRVDALADAIRELLHGPKMRAVSPAE